MDRADIERAFGLLDEELAVRQVQAHIVLVGGAALALGFSAREATRDVDVILIESNDQDAFRAAVVKVGHRMDLAPDWLNDRARVFATAITCGADLWTGGALKVSTASSEQLLGMKLSALRDDVDYDDAALLLRNLPGSKEEIWSRITPFLLPGMEEWKRMNFDILWEDVHGPA